MRARSFSVCRGCARDSLAEGSEYRNRLAVEKGTPLFTLVLDLGTAGGTAFDTTVGEGATERFSIVAWVSSLLGSADTMEGGVFSTVVGHGGRSLSG